MASTGCPSTPLRSWLVIGTFLSALWTPSARSQAPLPRDAAVSQEPESLDDTAPKSKAFDPEPPLLMDPQRDNPKAPDSEMQPAAKAARQAAPLQGSSNAPAEDVNDEPTKEVPKVTINMSYDANSVGINKELNRTVFDGNVVALGGGTLITADHVEVDNEKKILEARGHVVVLSGQVFLGDSLSYMWTTGDFKLTSATMVANDPSEGSKISNNLLGFTPRELAFEAQRQERILAVKRQREELRQEFRSKAKHGDEPTPQLLERYVLLYEAEDLARSQENPALARLAKERRSLYERRRKFWNQGAMIQASLPTEAAYFKIVGDELIRTNGNDFSALNATWTPCKCADDEAPAWGFHADRIDAQIEGYADLSHPVLEIKGVPILYLPMLKLPLKNRRQSGFLIPTLQTGSQANGTVYSQPVFLAFADNLDATVETDVFERRGTRLGTELRYEQRKYSGWTLKLENMRDSAWLTQRSNRAYVAEYFTRETPDCSEYSDPAELASCNAIVAGHNTADPDARSRELDRYFHDSMPIPVNTWRSKQEWRGQTFLAPRVSIVSRGQVLSDHRYVEDLTMADEFEAALTPVSFAAAYAPARLRTHLDGRDFYLGVGSSYGDNLTWRGRRYDGYQMPVYLKARSQYFSLNPAQILPLTPYGELAFDSIRIKQNVHPDPYTGPTPDTLGDGDWQRLAFNQVLPLIADGIVRVDQFGEAEARRITHPRNPAAASTIRSYRLGLTFRLPLDGVGPAPQFLQPENPEESGRQFIHHFMDWNVTLSARPVVIRDGTYGESLASGEVTYFSSDRKVHPGDDGATVEDSMVNHERITLDTSHRWSSFKKAWTILPGIPKATEAGKNETLRQKARRDLIYSLDRPIESHQDMFDETGTWFINRYQLNEAERIDPVSLSGSITYDFVQARLRDEALARNRAIEREAESAPSADAKERILTARTRYLDLPRPWDGPKGTVGVGLLGYSLANTMTYDIYARSVKDQVFSLGIPPFFGISWSLGYTVQRNFEKPPNATGFDAYQARKTNTRSLGMATPLIPRVSTTLALSDREVERLDYDPPAAKDNNNYRSVLSMDYIDDSGCWGLRFLRTKDFGVLEENASYLLQLSVIFMGQQRGQNVAPAILRELKPTEG